MADPVSISKSMEANKYFDIKRYLGYIQLRLSCSDSLNLSNIYHFNCNGKRPSCELQEAFWVYLALTGTELLPIDNPIP
jgi:hypothetical protein